MYLMHTFRKYKGIICQIFDPFINICDVFIIVYLCLISIRCKEIKISQGELNRINITFIFKATIAFQ